jgi:hypothetical protein
VLPAALHSTRFTFCQHTNIVRLWYHIWVFYSKESTSRCCVCRAAAACVCGLTPLGSKEIKWIFNVHCTTHGVDSSKSIDRGRKLNFIAPVVKEIDFKMVRVFCMLSKKLNCLSCQCVEWRCGIALTVQECDGLCAVVCFLTLLLYSTRVTPTALVTC